MAKTPKAGAASKRLAELLIDLAINDEFREWFNRDRAAAIASRKVSKAAASALMGSDSAQLKELLLNNQVQQAAARKATKKVRKSAKKR
jgi:hypothetical protein